MHKINEVKLTLYNLTEEHCGSVPGRVLDSGMRGLRVRASWEAPHCIDEKDTFILVLYWFNPGKGSPVAQW